MKSWKSKTNRFQYGVRPRREQKKNGNQEAKKKKENEYSTRISFRFPFGIRKYLSRGRIGRLRSTNQLRSQSHCDDRSAFAHLYALIYAALAIYPEIVISLFLDGSSAPQTVSQISGAFPLSMLISFERGRILRLLLEIVHLISLICVAKSRKHSGKLALA